MKRVALLLVLMVVCCAVVSAQTRVDYTVVVPEGKRIPLEAYRLNGRDYVPLSELLRSFFRGGRLTDNRTVVWGDEEFRTASASFYVLRSSGNGLRMAQMPYPVLELDGELCLPVLPLCSAVEMLGLYDTDVRGTVITLRRFAGHAPAVLVASAGHAASAEHSGGAAEIITGLNTFSDEGEPPQPEPPLSARQRSPAQKHSPAQKRSASMGSAAARVGIAVSVPHSRVGKQPPRHDDTLTMHSRVSGREKVSVPSTERSQKSTHRAVPYTAPKRADTVEALPGRYNLPPDLYRREILDDDSLHSMLEMSTPSTGFPLALLLGVPSVSPSAVEIVSIDVAAKSGVVDVQVAGSGPVENFQRPECSGRQLVLRFPGARNGISTKVLRQLGSTAPLVSVRFEQVGTTLIYKLTFSAKVERCSFSRRSSSRIVFTVHTATGADRESKAPTAASSEAKKWALDVIVLDAGHGGKDVGAVGVTGCYEKDITLAIVKKLGALIERHLPQTKVVYTRKDDRFVELFRRGQIANEAGGKLFISIHCNSMPTKPHPARGFETYILRPGRNEDAVRVAERENAAIRFESNQKRYKALTDEQFIVVNMAQSAFVKFSELFAATVQEEIGKSTSLVSRGVNQAGFYVLVGASMPNILFEAAFLSNKDDEKFINSDSGQDAVARGLFNAIRIYANTYEQMLEGQK